jgi:hypothetical protein
MRKLRFSSVFGVVSIVAAAGCSSSSNGGVASSVCATPEACPASATDLSGTWDLVGSSPNGTPQTGTISIAHNVFVITIGQSVLSYTMQGAALSVTWTDDGKTDNIVTSLGTPTTSTSYGIVPIHLGGPWKFADSNNPANECHFDGELGVFTAGCSGTHAIVPSYALSNVYTATRTQVLDSQFGDLGGTWKGLATNGDPSGGCTFTFQGSTISSSCAADSNWLAGTADLTFQGTSMASGKTGNGVEYSAKRR